MPYTANIVPYFLVYDQQKFTKVCMLTFLRTVREPVIGTANGKAKVTFGLPLLLRATLESSESRHACHFWSQCCPSFLVNGSGS